MTGGRRHAIIALDDRLDLVGREHFERRCAVRARQNACVSLPIMERAVGAITVAVCEMAA